MIQQQARRLVININDLRKDKPTRALALMKSSSKEIISFQRLLKSSNLMRTIVDLIIDNHSNLSL